MSRVASTQRVFISFYWANRRKTGFNAASRQSVAKFDSDIRLQEDQVNGKLMRRIPK